MQMTGLKLPGPALAAFGLLLSLSACRSSLPPKPAPPPPPKPVTVVAVGDILLGRQIGELMYQANDHTLPFGSIAPTLTAADITLGNLEGPICEKPPYPKAGMVFRVRPRAVEGLLFAGFDVLSVANNHTGDGGETCLRFTLQHLRNSGLLPCGAGAGFDEAHTPVIVERQGTRFAFLAYTYAERNDSPGVARPAVAGRNRLQMRLDVLRARMHADVVLVSLHDGAEYTRRVARETVQFARAAIEAGATAVFGHHPHVAQRVEPYKDGWIFYSLGNFVFQQPVPGTNEALLARLTFLAGKLVKVEALPVIIEKPSHPRLATDQEAGKILAAVGLNASLLWTAPNLQPQLAASGEK